MLQKALNELAQQIRIRAKYDNFIGGTWVPPRKGQYFTNITPITGKPLCEIARSTAEDLIEGGVLPESFKQFLDHAARFDSLHRLWKEKGIDTSHLPSPSSTQWPVDFDTDVEETLIRLKDMCYG